MITQNLKGFRDFLPEEAILRKKVIAQMFKIFEQFGFDPLETPALEYAQTLLNKYGEEADKLLYLFEDRGGRKVGLRYDQTVPSARIIAQYKNQLSFPFKRYQIQPVWRAENPQRGRFREFLQCDIDTIGARGISADAEIIVCALTTAKNLGFRKAKMVINDRSVFKKLQPQWVTTIDKLAKIGKEAVIKELVKKGMGQNEAEKIINSFANTNPTPLINSLFKLLKEEGLMENKDFQFDPTLARGLDYYTSTIYELVSDEYRSGSLGGGGRYDTLIGQFTGQNIPAVGFSFGFDRLIEAMKELKLMSVEKTSTKVLVTVFAPDLLQQSLKIVSTLRKEGINTDVSLDANSKLDKQLKYADKRGIPYVIILGPEEIKKKVVKLKNMDTGEQKEIKEENIVKFLISNS